MSLAIYRKYRPRVFEDLLGQAHVIEILKNAAREDKIAHAYLFHGPRGSGKTTTARLMAKVANCETRAGDQKFRAKGEPCNQCRPCTEIDSGRALDVIEIDAASNRGIDEIRNLKEGLNLSPTSYKYKTIIIDETHQLTKDAFNALLKTLEEPPEHAILILATTEYEKVPATIISRTQKFHFRKIPLSEIVKKLEAIVKKEKLNITDDALELVAASAEGSLRDAESLLDQLTSLKDKVDLESAERVIGKVGFKRTAQLAEEILKGDLDKALQYIESINEEGHNVVDLNKELIHYLRRAVSLSVNPGLRDLFKDQITDRELEKIIEHSQLIDTKKHIRLLQSLIRAHSEMRYSPFASIPLEVAIIENLKS
jgi:DNA polymerase III subunit gamma/tau